MHSSLSRREFLRQSVRTGAVAAAGLGLGAGLVPRGALSGETARPRPSRISYFRNGEIRVGEPGQSEGRPVTTGHMDFKPSWSKTGDWLVCFRRVKDDPVTVNWRSAIFVVNVDGTRFQLLTDGTRTDFNPTWTRDGKNTPVWNRKNDRTGGFFVTGSRVGGKPGEEVALTPEGFHTWAHSCLADGRILVNALHPALGWGVYLLRAGEGVKPEYEPVRWEMGAQGQMHRASISPGETRICFEFLRGHTFTEPGHTLYVADFDARERVITKPRAIANAAGRPIWFAYPRWIDGESAVVYHSSETGRNQLYVHRLDDGTTRRISTDPDADYRYPHGEAAPC